jgi:small subunit ribosomal protein S3
MAYVRSLLASHLQLQELDEFLEEELKEAGYAGVEVQTRALSINITIYATRPGLVIGRRGVGIKELQDKIQERFKLQKTPQLSVVEVPAPELDPRVMAIRIAQQIERGVSFRRAAMWAVNTVMAAGAMGVEVKIAGKLRTERARYEKYVAGVVPKSGQPREVAVSSAVRHVLLKPGLFGIKVKIAYKERLPAEFSVKESVAAPAPEGVVGEGQAAPAAQ